MRTAIRYGGIWIEIDVQHFDESRDSDSFVMSIIGTLPLPVPAKDIGEAVAEVVPPLHPAAAAAAGCDHGARTRFVGCGGRAYWICDACEQVVGRAEREPVLAVGHEKPLSTEPLEPGTPDYVELHAVDPGDLGVTPGQPGTLAAMKPRGRRANRKRDRVRQATAAETSPAPAAPTWGGRDPKDVDGETKAPARETVRFFTVELSGGRVMTNQSTAKGRTVEEAEAIVRNTWTKLGKSVAKMTYQPNGRVGEDTPVVKLPTAVDEDPEPEQPRSPAIDEGPGATYFRWDRATLEESVKTAVPCHTLSKLIEILRTSEKLEAVTVDDVKVEFWSYDERIEWNTYVVTVFGAIVGMTNGPL